MYEIAALIEYKANWSAYQISEQNTYDDIRPENLWYICAIIESHSYKPYICFMKPECVSAPV